MPKEIFWTPLAKESYFEVANQLMEDWDESEKIKLEELLDYRIKQISIHPELAPTFQNHNFRKLVIHKNRPDIVIILLVWDNRMNPQSLLSKLQSN